MKKLSRREFLSLMGTSGAYSALALKNTYPFNFLFEGLVQAFSSKMVHAAESGVGGNYMLFLHPGAPPRWGMDAFLSPNSRVVGGVSSSSEFILNSVVKNTLKAGSTYITAHTTDNNATTYETTNTPVSYQKRNGTQGACYLPKIWDVPLPVITNGAAVYNSSSPFYMRDLAANTCLVRGFQINADFGHIRGPSFLSQPQPQMPSLSGLVADASAVPIPAVAVTDSAGRPLGFRSRRSKITLAAGASGKNITDEIFSPFIRNEEGIRAAKANRALLEDALKQAFQVMEADAKKNYVKVDELYTNLRGVDELMVKLSSLNPIGDFLNLKDKYNKLVKACVRAEPGMIASYIGVTSTNGVITGVDYQRDDYSESFALAEYLIKNKICSSFTFLCGGSAVAGSFFPGQPASANNDEHNGVSRFLSASNHNWKYRAFMACVNEFRKSIGETEWKKTVIQHGAEYARSPHQFNMGSDHAINACSTTILSGAFDKFIPIGNVQRTEIPNAAHANYGTYGVGAPTDIEGLGQGHLTFEYVMNSILGVLGLSSPFRDKSSLLKMVGNSWVSNCEDPKNV